MTGYTPPVTGTPAWDGPLNDVIGEIDVDMQARALDADVVHTTGEETIAGEKHFQDGITVPAASIPKEAIDGLVAALSELVEAAGGAVISVNEQTGAVTLSAADVGALADDATFDDLTDGATNVAFTTALRTKLNGIATSATANQSDATLKNRANHTGTQTASTISDLIEVVIDAVADALVQGTGISIAYNDGTGKITVSNTGSGGGGGALYARATATRTTPSLAEDEVNVGSVALGPSFKIGRLEVDGPCRVRVYASGAQATADSARAASTAPTGNHGLVLDVVVNAAWFAITPYVDITPAVEGMVLDGGNAAVSITNLDTVARAVQVTFTYQRTED